jgi:hypothetical protein
MIQPDKRNLTGRVFSLGKKVQQPVGDVRGAEKALGDAAEELKTEGVLSLRKFADRVLEYARTIGEAYNHQKHEITRLKLGQDIREIEEERAKGNAFREMSLTIRFFRHIYDFALEGGLLPDKMKRYVNMFRNLVIFGTAAAILAVPATGVNIYLLRKIARENQSLLGLSDNVRNQQGMISKLEAGLNGQATQISDIRNTQEVYGRNQKLTDEKIQANYDAIEADITSLRLGAEERERQITEQSKTLADLASTYEKGIARVYTAIGSFESNLTAQVDAQIQLITLGLSQVQTNVYELRGELKLVNSELGKSVGQTRAVLREQDERVLGLERRMSGYEEANKLKLGPKEDKLSDLIQE